MCVRRGDNLHTPWMKAQACVYHMCQLGPFLTLESSPNLTACATVSRLHFEHCSFASPSLVYLSALFLSMFHQLCDHVDVETVQESEKASIPCRLNPSSLSWTTGSLSSLCFVLLSFRWTCSLPCSFRPLFSIYVVSLRSSRFAVGPAWGCGSALFNTTVRSYRDL